MSTPARPSLTERRADELRLTIALTARDLFMADGDTSATVERMCEIVGINPRTFHRHFPVKEDVVIPLFRQSQAPIVETLKRAAPKDDPVETLVHAFTTRVIERRVEEFDREFMTLIVENPQYRLRWLDWGDDLCAPLTDYLAGRFDLGADTFVRILPAQLIIHTSRQVYVHWVYTGDFADVQAAHRTGMKMILGGLRPLKRNGAA